LTGSDILQYTAGNNMTWIKDLFIRHKKVIIGVAIYLVVFALMLFVWHLSRRGNFVWKNFAPIPAPGILERAVYSVITFLTTGRILYKLKFYKILKIICVDILGSWGLYNVIKDVVWRILMLATIFWIIPWIIDALNGIISFFYNLPGLILYSAPALGFSLLICLPAFFYIKKFMR